MIFPAALETSQSMRCALELRAPPRMRTTSCACAGQRVREMDADHGSASNRCVRRCVFSTQREFEYATFPQARARAHREIFRDTHRSAFCSGSFAMEPLRSAESIATLDRVSALDEAVAFVSCASVLGHECLTSSE
jgi:hypothetical protein